MFANYYLSFGIPYHVIIFVMLYYLAYRKSGTQLLIFIMSLKLLSFLMIPEMSYAFLSSDFKILNYCGISIDFFINLGWFFLSFQIVKINIRRQLLLLQNYMDEEQSIRNRWLSFSIAHVVYAIYSTYLVTEEISPYIFTIFLNVIILALLYHFVYKKSGTILLIFLILQIFWELLICIALSPGLFKIPFKYFSILNYCESLIDFFINLGWFFLSFQLIEINTRKKRLEKCLLLQNCMNEEMVY